MACTSSPAKEAFHIPSASFSFMSAATVLNYAVAIAVPQHAGGPPTSRLPFQLRQMLVEVLEPAEQLHQKSAPVFSLMAAHAQTLRAALFGALQGFTAAVEALGQQALQVGTAARIQAPAMLEHLCQAAAGGGPQHMP